jgi:hypothetical protein
MMIALEGQFLLREQDNSLVNVALELVADLLEMEPGGGYRLTVHFGRAGHRAGFGHHRYSVDLPRGAVELKPLNITDNGYQLARLLRLLPGRVEIDDPIDDPAVHPHARPKPNATRITYYPP